MIRNKDADIIRAIKNSACKCDGDETPSSVVLEELTVTENDTYNAEEGKAWNKVNVNVQGGGGSGVFNINDIILADDLLEKCQARGLQENEGIDTDWTFEDICTQDSCGILQAAFEDAVYEVNPEYPDESYVNKSVFIYLAGDDVEVTPFGQHYQEILVYEPNSANYFSIAYNPTTEKYRVEYFGGMV